jgi:hypothetical protein
MSLPFVRRQKLLEASIRDKHNTDNVGVGAGPKAEQLMMAKLSSSCTKRPSIRYAYSLFSVAASLDPPAGRRAVLVRGNAFAFVVREY